MNRAAIFTAASIRLSLNQTKEFLSNQHFCRRSLTYSLSYDNFNKRINAQQQLRKQTFHTLNNNSKLLKNSSISYGRAHLSVLMEHCPTTEVDIPMPWGCIKAQIFGSPDPKKTPILAAHGYLDNSNSFKPIAPYLCSNGYYIISLDLPGHGLSSHFPDGIPYTPKLFLAAIRRVVYHFHLKNFVFMTHSYGTSLALMYDTVFPDEVMSIIMFDYVFSTSSKKWLGLPYYWKQGIDTSIELENELAEKRNKKEPDEEKREPLTKEKAVKILLDANKHLDENSASILMERGLTKNKVTGRLEFSRDIRVKKYLSMRDHYTETISILPEVCKKLTAPVLFIYANPPSYGQDAYNDTMKTINDINTNSNTNVRIVKFDGTHHFHMIHPKEASEITLKFLDEKLKIDPSVKL